MAKRYDINKDEEVEVTQEDWNSLETLHRKMAKHYRENDLKNYEKFWQTYKV